MGELILCKKQAKVPYYNSFMDIHIYSLEELCFFMESNVYLLDETWISDALIHWLETEISESDLAGKIRTFQKKGTDLYEILSMIFAESGFYSATELSVLYETFEGMKGKTGMERRKMRADRYLAGKKYKRAAYNYMELLQPDCIARMTEELHGEILHNLGVAYARMFLFQEAAAMFASAYKVSHQIPSREAYLYAMNYVPDNYPMDEDGMDINFTIMKDALNRFSEVGDDPDYYIERKEASKATDAFNWRSTRRSLLERWQSEFLGMNS